MFACAGGVGGGPGFWSLWVGAVGASGGSDARSGGLSVVARSSGDQGPNRPDGAFNWP